MDDPLYRAWLRRQRRHLLGLASTATLSTLLLALALS